MSKVNLAAEHEISFFLDRLSKTVARLAIGMLDNLILLGTWNISGTGQRMSCGQSQVGVHEHIKPCYLPLLKKILQ